MNYYSSRISKYYSYDNRFNRQSPIDKYEILGKIGSGSYGNVFKVRNKLTKNIYALKKVNLFANKKENNLYLVNELKILTYNQSNYLLKSHEIFMDRGNICIVMDYAEKGDLRQYIKKYKNNNMKISERRIWHFLIQILLAIEYLHRNNIIHRDIKTANIMINKDYSISVGDFGVSKILKPDINLATTQIGTPYYLCPEIIKGKNYDKKADIWAIGCILCEMMTLDYAFLSNNIHALNYKIIEGKYNLDNLSYSESLIDLVKKMLTTCVERRPDIYTLVNMPVIQDKLANRIYLMDSPKTNTLKKKILRNITVPKYNSEWEKTISEFNKDMCFNSPTKSRPMSVINRRANNFLPPIKIL